MKACPFFVAERSRGTGPHATALGAVRFPVGRGPVPRHAIWKTQASGPNRPKAPFFQKRSRRREGDNPANPLILQILIQTTEGSRGTGPRTTDLGGER